MFECLLEFRDVRAETIHSDERIYTAWLPSRDEDIAVDWGMPAVKDPDPERLEEAPRTSVRSYEPSRKLTSKQMDQIQADLIDHLGRGARLELYYNPYLKLYSKLSEGRDEFVHRVMDEMFDGLQPKLKELARRLQLQLEQLRESPLPDDLSQDTLDELEAIRRQMISTIESKMDALIMGNSEPLSKRLLYAPTEIRVPDEIREMKEELGHIEREILGDLNALVMEYTTRACECDEYQIRLQPTNIKVIRRALLWVPRVI